MPSYQTIAEALIAALTALATWGGTAFADGHVNPVEWFGLCGVAVVAIGTWTVPNKQ
jgi:hypothetical protein